MGKFGLDETDDWEEDSDQPDVSTDVIPMEEVCNTSQQQKQATHLSPPQQVYKGLFAAIQVWFFRFTPWSQYHTPSSSAAVKKKVHRKTAAVHKIKALEPLHLPLHLPSPEQNLSFAAYLLTRLAGLLSNQSTRQNQTANQYADFCGSWAAFHRQITATSLSAENTSLFRYDCPHFLNFLNPQNLLSQIRKVFDCQVSNTKKSNICCSSTSFLAPTPLSLILHLLETLSIRPPKHHTLPSANFFTPPPSVNQTTTMESTNNSTPSLGKYPSRLGVDSTVEREVENLSSGFKRAMIIPGAHAREVTLSPTVFGGKKKGKFLAVKVLSVNEEKWKGYAGLIKSAFKAVAEVKVRYSGGLTFSVEFDEEKDAIAVLRRSPWTIENASILLIVKELGRFQLVKDIVFDRALLWVQVHDIPEEVQTADFSNSLLYSIGWPEKTTCKYHTIGNTTVSRTKVWVPLQQPLSSTLYANYEEEFVRFPTSLRYEKAGLICFRCARLGHVAASCWEPAFKPDSDAFKSLVATPLNQRDSARIRKSFKDLDMESTTKNLLQEFDLEATFGEHKEEKGPNSQLGSTSPAQNKKRNGEEVMRELGNPSPSACCKNLEAEGTVKSIWPAMLNLCGREGKNTDAPLFSLTSSFDVSLNPRSDFIVNLKRPLSWSVGTNSTAHAFSNSPVLKYGPKRNGPGPAWRLSKKALGLEPPTPSTATDSDYGYSFAEQEEDSPSQWLLLGNTSKDAGSDKEYDPSELSETEDTAGSSQQMPKRQRREVSD